MCNSFLSRFYYFVRYILTLYVTLVCTCFIKPVLANTDEYKSEIMDGAKDYLNELIELQDGERANVTINPFSRSITICEGVITYELTTPKLKKNNPIKVTCDSETTPYSFYLTSRVVIEKPYVTVINPVTKNDILDANNLTISYQDKVLDKGTTFQDPNVLDGIMVKRDIRPGQPILKNNICVVCKGNEVTIEATNGNFSIKTAGIAMDNGSYNEKIKVKNIKSGKIVRAVVIDRNLVEVQLK